MSAPDYEAPEWALLKAHDLMFPKDVKWSDRRKLDYFRPRKPSQAFARYIAQHETPPVDPDLLLAREIAARCLRDAGHDTLPEEVEAGKVDHVLSVQSALAAIRAVRAQEQGA